MYTTHITPLEHGDKEGIGTLTVGNYKVNVTTKANIMGSCFHVYHTHQTDSQHPYTVLKFGRNTIFLVNRVEDKNEPKMSRYFHQFV